MTLLIEALVVTVVLLSLYALFERSRGRTAEALNENQDEKNNLLKLDRKKQRDDGAAERKATATNTAKQEQGVDDESDADLADDIDKHS